MGVGDSLSFDDVWRRVIQDRINLKCKVSPGTARDINGGSEEGIEKEGEVRCARPETQELQIREG
jgi:hypothetical protein